MKTIWKFELEITDEQYIKAPLNMTPLSAQIQNGQLVLWGIVDPKGYVGNHRVLIVGTGNPLPDMIIEGMSKYLSTVQDGAFVWHVFVDA